MFNICVCDDNSYFLNLVTNIIIEFYKNYKDVKIQSFQNAKEVLKCFQNFDLIFLDIEMPGINGLNFKKKLEEFNFKGKIVYVTYYEHYMNEAFGKNVIAYILKSDLNRIQLVLQQIEKERKRSRIIRIGETNINISCIYYIKADRGYVNIHTEKGVLYFSIYLNDILRRINDNTFMQVHRSYIINFRYINTFNVDKIILINGEVIKLSRKYKSAFKNSYFKYLQGE